MKKVSVITVLALAVAISSCSDVRRTPGRNYMPDMAYSRAIETYSNIDTLEKQGIHYNRLPVPGTIKRGELFPFPIAKDKQGDSTNYVLSKQVVNPLPALNEKQLVEAERLYLINCGICHGAALDGEGPLKKRPNGAEGPYGAQPAKLVGNPTYERMPDGQLFYSITYGKGQMGSYASQLSTTQRWMVIHYIRSKQGGGKAAAADSTAASAAPAGVTPAASGTDTAKTTK
jgi:mono/diheme cytochrome c family protein